MGEIKMKFAFIIVIVILSCFFVGVPSAQVRSITQYISGNLEVCSSGIRGNACDRTSKQGSDDAGLILQTLPHAERDKVLYMSYVESRIATNFVLPPGIYNNLSAVIIIKLSGFGNIRSDFEKRSGNPNFDKAATEAINAAAPFGRPPRQLANMTIRVTFHP
jgi:TonB family protein